MPEQLRSKQEQDDIVLEVYTLANHHATDLVRSQHREDVVHDFVLECLRDLRTHAWHVPRHEIERFVQERLINRRTHGKRTRRRALIRDAKFLWATFGLIPEWVSADDGVEDVQLRRFVKRVRATLSGECVRAHRLVRDKAMTYEQAGRKLGLPAERVHEYIKTVQRAFRDALPTIGIEPPRSARGGRLARHSRAKRHTSLASGLVAATAVVSRPLDTRRSA